MLARPHVGRAQVDDRVALGLGLVVEHAVLGARELQLRADREPAVRQIEAQRPPQRRNARQRLVGGGEPRVDVADAEGRPGAAPQPEARAGVPAPEPAVALVEVEDREAVGLLAGAFAEDEVVDAVDVDVHAGPRALGLVAQAQVEAERRLGVEIGVADLEGEVPDVGTEVVQLLEGGGAVRRRDVGHERAARAEIGVEAEGRRAAQELPVPRVGGHEIAVVMGVVVMIVVVMVVVVLIVVVVVVVMIVVVLIVVVMIVFMVVVMIVAVVVVPPFRPLVGPVVVPLDAAAELQPEASEVELLVGERGERRLVRPRRQGLDPDRLELAHLGPGPEPA